ncbi:MAG: hypothetical protein JNK34_01400 [Tabrizicola sp.]|nr:hypothetical protein [Tabrizicola sp.]
MSTRATENLHVGIAKISAALRSKQLVDEAPQLGSLMAGALERNESSRNRQAVVIGKQRALMRQFQSRLGGLIQRHSRDLLGRTRNKADLLAVFRELHGEVTGDAFWLPGNAVPSQAPDISKIISCR